MEPPLVSGGRRMTASGVVPQSQRFNGAAAGERRKDIAGGAKVGAVEMASMEPPLVSGGRKAGNCAALPSARWLQWSRRW